MSDIDWDNLRVVLAVARGGSLTAAASILGVDQTTAGRRLNAVEEQLGATLFLRSKAGFKITEQGSEVLATATEIEVRMEGLTDALTEPATGAAGLLRLLGNPWMLERLAGERMAALLAENPRLQVRMSGRLPPVPVHGGTMVSLWFDAEARAPDVAIPVGRIPYAAYQSVDLPDDCNDWVIFRDDDARGPSFNRRLAKRLKGKRTIRLTATDATIIRAAALARIGRAVLPVCLGDEAPGLIRDPGFRPIERILHVHINPDMATTRRVSTFLDWIRPAVAEAFGGEALPLPALDALPR